MAAPRRPPKTSAAWSRPLPLARLGLLLFSPMVLFDLMVSDAGPPLASQNWTTQTWSVPGGDSVAMSAAVRTVQLAEWVALASPLADRLAMKHSWADAAVPIRAMAVAAPATTVTILL